MNKGSKISDEQFLSILRENAGLFAQTARAISKQFGIKYSRQAVYDRVQNHLEELEDIKEESLDIAEAGLLSLMDSETESIKLKAIELLLKTKGKKRGYVERQEVSNEIKAGKNIKIEIIDAGQSEQSIQAES